MAPRRPLVHPDQAGLVVVSLLALASGIYFAIRMLAG